MSNEILSPENMLAGNELICAKLLGWKLVYGGWIKSDGYMYSGCGTPTFTTWAGAGLIIEALAMLNAFPDLNYGIDRVWKCSVSNDRYHRGDTGPLAIRAAALEYIRRKS